jgi:hypothetical protein
LKRTIELALRSSIERRQSLPESRFCITNWTSLGAGIPVLALNPRMGGAGVAQLVAPDASAGRRSWVADEIRALIVSGRITAHGTGRGVE